MANSLRWGPDGWIYATHGSTVTAYVRRHGMDNQPIQGEDPVHRMGQFAWRYHPETHQYEVFAEGGGNAFGVEIDSLGRVYSGHNGGNTRGFHYVQGGYYRKTFGKHGNLSNPYAFSHFPSMAHPNVKRFTHTFEIYEDTALPSRYHGKLFGASPNLHYIVASNIQTHGSTFRTEDIDLPVSIGDDPFDKWFAPVDIQTGPDGNLYIADFHARQIAHYIAYSKGLTDPMLGRVYRLKGKHVTGDNSKHVTKDAFKDANLVETTLRHPSRWHRETALRILGDRKSPVHNEQFKKALLNETGQPALQALWALNLCGGFGKEVALQALRNKNAHVRRWTIRLLGDQRRVSPDVAAAMVRAAAKETDTETRAQFASTAGRLPAKDAHPILAHLIQRKEDAGDPHLPQLVWWAFETHADNHEALLDFFRDRRNWDSQLRTDGALPQQNLMRRWALSGSQAELEACAELLGLAPDAENTNRLLKGFQKAFEGRALPPLPAKLTDALSRAQGQESLILAIRKNNPEAISKALNLIKNPNHSTDNRIQLTRALGDIQNPVGIPTLIDLVRTGKKQPLQLESILALQKFKNPQVGKDLAPLFFNLSAKLQPATLNLLSSRPTWARHLLETLENKDALNDFIDPETLAKLRLHTSNKAVKRILDKQFPRKNSNINALQHIEKHLALAKAGGGNPKLGEAIFHGKSGCGACHTLFSRGGQLGPDLTPYDRTDLSALILAIVHPDAEIREGYENLLLTTIDGRVLSGFRTEANPQLIILRGLDGQDHLIPRAKIKTLTPAGRSLMPPGLLNPLTTDERRHLLAYLTSTTPPK